MFDMTFVTWMQEELDKRKWTRSDLARASGINPTSLTNIYNGRRNAGGNLLRKIAKGFDIPAEVVFHAYGLLEARKDTDDIIAQVMHDMGGFSMEDKEEILEYVRMKRRLAETRGVYRISKSE